MFAFIFNPEDVQGWSGKVMKENKKNTKKKKIKISSHG